jgi:hypothetical protein
LRTFNDSNNDTNDHDNDDNDSGTTNNNGSNDDDDKKVINDTGAEINAKNVYSHTPLTIAINKSHSKVCWFALFATFAAAYRSPHRQAIALAQWHFKLMVAV